MEEKLESFQYHQPKALPWKGKGEDKASFLFNSYGKEVVPLGKALPAGLICVIKTASATLELQ